MVQEDVFIKQNGVKVSVNDMKRYWREKPDIGFSETHNKSVIANSIKRAEKLRAARVQAQGEAIDQRVDAVASYLRYLDKGGSSDAEKYFGKATLAELRGERVKAELIQAKTNGQKLWKLVDSKYA